MTQLRYVAAGYIYGNVRATQWQAIALDVAYSTLDSQADGLTVLAVAQWIEACKPD
jgi:hypothetical protein